MSIAFEVDVSSLVPGIREIADDFAKISWTKAFKLTAVELAYASRKCFDESRAPDGTPWAPLKQIRYKKDFSDKTGKRLRRDKNGKFVPKVDGRIGKKIQGPRRAGKPLQDNGILYASVTAQGKGHIEKMDDLKLVWGTNIEYAAPHQDGAKHKEIRRAKGQKPLVFPGPDGTPIFSMSRKAYTMPARPFLGFVPELADSISKIFADELVRQMGATK